VKVLVTGYAPSNTASGKTVAVAARMSDYAVGLASEVKIKPKEIPGDTNTYFEAMIFANGDRILDKNFFGLIAL